MSVISDYALLPCPLCGGEVIGYEIHPHSHAFATFMPDHPGSYVAECPECDFYLTRPTRTETAAAWNRRTVPSHEGVREWRPIETAPKDGTWLELWRGPIDGAGIWSPLVVGRWWEFDDGGSWAWPDDVYDPWHDRTTADAYLERGDCYDSEGFTHWRPLAAPPAFSPNKEDEDARA